MTSSFTRGFAPVERDQAGLVLKHPTAPPHISVAELLATIPDSVLVQKAQSYIQTQLPTQIYRHSLRTYLLGAAVAKVQFPEWQWDPESFYLACLFHDLGCTPENIAATKLSFELYGAFLARSWLVPDYSKATQDEKDIADSVVEAIARHIDFVEGKCTTHVQLLQIGTQIDILGRFQEWLAPATIAEINERFPREGWTSSLYHAFDTEVKSKPWCHITCLKKNWSQVPPSPRFGPA